ncbi:TIGR02530 family flagellar biosynthesis protein [Sediminibacillus albus]|uniref:Flagellar operon protein n=1 Tax=Sediminibacillus albus TaxID=407036 RepID=A0A1G8W2N0_9BACI|nr:TIGR02530 family flagellar biosynthesis protein [Sediminibacillus albus]SDJ72346.1 flagellar operon protein [Sediminibacillus albus]
MDHRIQQLQQPMQIPAGNKGSPKVDDAASFKKILTEAQGLKVSKHAKQRLTERKIDIDTEQWQKISDKIGEAKQKGITDSLVLTNEAALLVSTKNNTVVTAMNRAEAASRIFTNINGTILMDE